MATLDPTIPVYALRKCLTLYEQPDYSSRSWGDDNNCVWGTATNLQLAATPTGVEKNGFAEVKVQGSTWVGGFLGVGGHSEATVEIWWIPLKDVSQTPQLSEEEKKAKIKDDTQKKINDLLDDPNPTLTASNGGLSSTTKALFVIAGVGFAMGLLIYVVAAKPKKNKVGVMNATQTALKGILRMGKPKKNKHFDEYEEMYI